MAEKYQIIGECEVNEKGEIVKLDRGWFRQGYVYKNYEAYHNDKAAVCYVPELSDTAYTGQDILDMCNGQPEIADWVFEEVDWQGPSAYLGELGDDELCMCECGKWYWCYGVSHCPHCGAENPSYDEKQFKKGGDLMEEKFVDINMQIKVTSGDIDEIMIGALEGGIPYWCRKVKVVGDYRGRYASEQISRGGKLLIYDYKEKTPYCLDLEKLLNGIRLWAKKPVGCNCLEYIDGKLVIDCSNADAEVCDSIVQYALFGDVIYG